MWVRRSDDDEMVLLGGLGTFPAGTLSVSYDSQESVFVIVDDVGERVLVRAPLEELRDGDGNPFAGIVDAFDYLTASSAPKPTTDFLSIYAASRDA